MRYRVTHTTGLRYLTLPANVLALIVCVVLYPAVGAFRGIAEGFDDLLSDVREVWRALIA